ncbi:MAG TPA: hypothetical protein DCG14_06090 [Phycisphaerales bacterium]|nr:hypothetical protein [Phycisphaerales bacterium]
MTAGLPRGPDARHVHELREFVDQLRSTGEAVKHLLGVGVLGIRPGSDLLGLGLQRFEPLVVVDEGLALDRLFDRPSVGGGRPGEGGAREGDGGERGGEREADAG